jgi:hypothetical protein
MYAMRILTDRDYLIQVIERLKDKGGFAVSLGQAALLADEDNLKILINSYPHIFIEGQALRLVK